VFSKQENVELALGVMAAGQAIREKIIREFLTKLEEKLRQGAKELGKSWKVVNDLIKDPFGRWKQVYITNEEWGDCYAFAMEPEKPGPNGFVLGVWSNWEKPPKDLDEAPIRVALEERFGRAMTNEGVPFYMLANQRYRDWDDPETLSRLHGDRALQAIEHFADTMVTMASTTEKIIDKLVGEYRERHQRE
jgi:hypothetical protein